MDNKRETHLWEQIDRLIFIIAILGLIILIGSYFLVANSEHIESTVRNLILNIITNIIPTFLLFIGAYLVFRRIENLRSERDADEIANRVVLKVFQILEQMQTNAVNTSNDPLSLMTEDFRVPIDMKLDLELEVNAQPFEPKLNPQKVVIECNYRGSNPIYIKKITYGGTNLKAKEHLSNIYKLDGFDDIILEEQVKVSSGIPYTFDLVLANSKKWKKSEIESWYKNLGFLHFEIEYNEQLIKDLQKKI